MIPLAVPSRRLATKTPADILAFGLAQRLVTLGAQCLKLTLQLARAAFEIGGLVGLLAQRWRVAITCLRGPKNDGGGKRSKSTTKERNSHFGK